MSNNPYETPIATSSTPVSPSRVGVALVCLHVSAFFYLVLGLVIPALLSIDTAARRHDAGAGSDGGTDGTFVFVVFLLCVLMAAAVEVVAYGIHKRKFWGWIGGLIIFGLYAPSICFPFGLLGFWGLLAPGSREEFGIGRVDGRSA